MYSVEAGEVEEQEPLVGSGLGVSVHDVVDDGADGVRLFFFGSH